MTVCRNRSTPASSIVYMREDRGIHQDPFGRWRSFMLRKKESVNYATVDVFVWQIYYRHKYFALLESHFSF